MSGWLSKEEFREMVFLDSGFRRNGRSPRLIPCERFLDELYAVFQEQFGSLDRVFAFQVGLESIFRSYPLKEASAQAVAHLALNIF